MSKPRFKFVPDDIRNLVIDECAACVPTTWLDPLLSGPNKVGNLPARETEALLRGIQDRIRALKSSQLLTGRENNMIRIIIKTERRCAPGSPIVTSHEVIEIEAPEVAERISAGGYNEDGTFEVSQVISVEVPRDSKRDDSPF